MKNSFTLQKESTLREAVQALDDGGSGFLAFVDDQGILLGILTDGDLRRAILNKNNDLHAIINPNPVTMSSTSSRHEVLSQLKVIHRRHMPLVDDDNRLISIFSLDDVEFVSKDNPIVVMAGGLGSRLGRLTSETPKPMLCVGDKPILRHIVEQCRDQGFYHFIFCLNYKSNVIKDYFGSGDRFGVKIEYVVEEERMGTAGALGLIDKSLEKPFFVINGDVLCNLDLNDFLSSHQEQQSLATMCVRQHQQDIPYGVVMTDENDLVSNIKEKPSYFFKINAGVYIFEPAILDYIPKKKFYDMTDLLDKLLLRGERVKAFVLDEYWMDIGKKEDFYKANSDMFID